MTEFSKMKRSYFIKLLERNGFWLKREVTNHDIYFNVKNTEPVPRHRDIKEKMVKDKIKQYEHK